MLSFLKRFNAVRVELSLALIITNIHLGCVPLRPATCRDECVCKVSVLSHMSIQQLLKHFSTPSQTLSHSMKHSQH